MTRVLMTTDAVGGVWTYSIDLAGALRAHGVDVALAVIGPAPREHQRRQLEQARITPAAELPHALEWMDEPWSDVDASGRELLALAARLDADLVHLNGYAHGSMQWGRPVVAVAHSDVRSWWHHVRGDAARPNGETYRRRVRDGLQAADAVVTVTRAGRADLRREYGVEATHTILNGRSTDWVQLRPKEPFVLGAGRLWDEAKNLRALELAALDLDWPVLLAGEPPPDRAGHVLRDAGHLLLPRGVHRGVRLLGELAFEELASWMARAAVFASPARYEPFGLSSLEAALSGCALVLGDIETSREVWGDRALYVPPDDTQALHQVLLALCSEPARCVELGACARERARELTAAVMAGAYAALYREVSGGAAEVR